MPLIKFGNTEAGQDFITVSPLTFVKLLFSHESHDISWRLSPMRQGMLVMFMYVSPLDFARWCLHVVFMLSKYLLNACKQSWGYVLSFLLYGEETEAGERR